MKRSVYFEVRGKRGKLNRRGFVISQQVYATFNWFLVAIGLVAGLIIGKAL